MAHSLNGAGIDSFSEDGPNLGAGIDSFSKDGPNLGAGIDSL